MGAYCPSQLAHLFLNPQIYDSITTPLYFPQTRASGTPEHPTLPLLTRYAHSALSYSRKLEMQAELAKTLSPGSASGSGSGSWFGRGGPKLDLEDVQRQGEECIDLLAAKLENEGRGWFFGTEWVSLSCFCASGHMLILPRPSYTDKQQSSTRSSTPTFTLRTSCTNLKWAQAIRTGGS